MIVRLVRGGLYNFATQDDKTAASVRLRKHLFGGPPEPRGQPGTSLRPVQVPELSADARLVAAVRAVSWRCLPAAEAREAGMDARALG